MVHEASQEPDRALHLTGELEARRSNSQFRHIRECFRINLTKGVRTLIPKAPFHASRTPDSGDFGTSDPWSFVYVDHAAEARK